ncbi:hypothetical protein [Streptomyces sp. SBT349]|uniref:hypothetical protein n=1 Tax=Streptomyces sp. SBT349 TaxID=1580539 RepID=UPI00066C7F66|nr:hypothetical protein [Streptomyces sp. SBT349]
MTEGQVIDLLGPPHDRLTTEEFLGGARTGPVPGPARSAPPAAPVRWYYRDLPSRGMATVITFRRGVVARVTSRPAERAATDAGAGPPDRAGKGARHEWARELITRHIARVEADRPDFAALPAWRRLTGADVLDFVLNADAHPRHPGQLGCRRRRFGSLTVLVSLFDIAAPDRIRDLLPGGYLPHLDHLLHRSGAGAGIGAGAGQDTAHWLLGRAPDGATVAHLAYLPASRGAGALVPWDLLSEAERRRGAGPL